jgi:chorismate synthase
MRWVTAGESHGKGLSIIVDDVPAGIPFCLDTINHQLARRQQGYGRGGRMTIETDTASVTAGVRFGQTTGAPISLWIENKDSKNWTDIMAPEGQPLDDVVKNRRFSRPRPGHADLAGYYKYGHSDLRDVLERASARETAARVAAGSVARMLLQALDITIFSHVLTLGGINVPPEQLQRSYPDIFATSEPNDLHCAGDDVVLKAMRQAVDEALKAGSTLGGEIEVVALNVPPGLGTYVQWDRKLDGLLAQAVMSVQAVKSVAIGEGTLGATLDGKRFHDAIVLKPQGITRPTNRAGGLEGGVTNGQPVLVRAIMKPIATLRSALDSVNLDTCTPESAHFERSDITAVPACGVVCEAMVALVLATAVMNKFGHDSLKDITMALGTYRNGLKPKSA